MTRGNPAGPLSIFNHLNPAQGIYTGITVNHTALIGQTLYAPGGRSARLSFLTPEDSLDQPDLSSLLEGLAAQSGEWGALHLLAEVSEMSSALELLRRNAFTIYGRQSIWRFTEARADTPAQGSRIWIPASPAAEINARCLFQQLVPPLVQAAEPFTDGIQRLIHRQDNELMAYVEICSGKQGVFVMPVFHPDVHNAQLLLQALLQQLPPSRPRPLYFCVRSYQGGLDASLTEMGGERMSQQALMVKHLAALQRSFAPLKNPVREVLKADPGLPIVQPAKSYAPTRTCAEKTL